MTSKFRTAPVATRQPAGRARVRVGRYAPSPTGALHLGNLLAAVVAHARARRDGSRFLLRMEDLDEGRCSVEAAHGIMDDLDRLGFAFDAGPRREDSLGPYVQSQCRSRYDAALEKLREQGHLFACECSRKDLAVAASAPHAGEDGPPYPGTCREKGLPFNKATRPVAWRFQPPAGETVVTDALCGIYRQDVAAEVGAFVVRRKDGVPAYHLAVVVDDAHQGVTEVVRGRDLLSCTPRQVALQDAFSFARPAYAHGPLWVDAGGERLAKRRGDHTVRSLLERESPGHVLGRVAAALGVADRGEAVALPALTARITDACLAVEVVRSEDD